jgi:hypothetical protein
MSLNQKTQWYVTIKINHLKMSEYQDRNVMHINTNWIMDQMIARLFNDPVSTAQLFSPSQFCW